MSWELAEPTLPAEKKAARAASPSASAPAEVAGTTSAGEEQKTVLDMLIETMKQNRMAMAQVERSQGFCR